MAQRNRRILLIDGFAGPGEYEGGEEGSPIIALRAFLEHPARERMGAEVGFFFIEKDQRRADHLEQLVAPYRAHLPPNCTAQVAVGEFDETMTLALNSLEEHARGMAPAFVMVDPFGVSGTPMRVMSRVLANPKTEVYVSLMYDFISRFRNTEEFGSHLDELFGTADWRRGIDIADPDERREFFLRLYEQQLRAAGARQVLRFDLYEGERLVYSIFFGTQHILGSDRMKQAIWKIAPSGDFAFRGTRSGQLGLDLTTADFRPLRSALHEQFDGGEPVGIQAVLDYVSSDATDYHGGQVKRVLKEMELEGEIEVFGARNRRRGKFPPGVRVRFL